MYHSRTKEDFDVGQYKNMTKGLKVNDQICVPRKRVGLDINSPSAVHYGKVVELNGRSAKITLEYDEISEYIPTSAILRHVKVMIFEIGDFDTESSLLRPLQETISDYFRLLLKDDEVLCKFVRGIDDMKRVWNDEHSSISHVIFIGHGRENAIKFGDDWINPQELIDVFNIENSFQKQFISLCCNTGYADFGREFSKFEMCEFFVAPFQSVHGSVASQFCQAYFTHHILNGETGKVAFNNARNNVPDATNFRMWQRGKFVAGKKS